MEFFRLLDLIEEKQRTLVNGWANPLVTEICDTYTQYEPPVSIGELLDFINHFKNAVQLELKKVDGDGGPSPKRGADDRVEALTQLGTWAENYETDHGKNAESPHFLGIRLYPFTFQLALRIRKPALIDQMATSMCGSVALLYSFGKESPLGLAAMGMSLYAHGAGNFRQILLEPSPRTKSGFNRRRSSGLIEADYVLLTSLRECAGTSGLGPGFNVMNQTLTAGTLCRILEQSGYTDVVDHSFVETVGLGKVVQKVLNQNIHFETHQGITNLRDRDQKIDNLVGAEHELDNGRVVLLMGHGDIADAIQNQRTRIPRDFFGHSLVGKTLKRHITAVRRIRVDVPRQTVTVRMITWGRRYDGSINLADFLNLYEGYVSATP